MEAVKISPKFQVVIPREIRDKLHLVPGQRLQARHMTTAMSSFS